MADEKQPSTGNELFPADWKEQVKLYGGRKGFIRQELKRLGFWPPQPGSKYKWKTQGEEAELEKLYAELIRLRGPLLDQLDAIDARIADAKKQIRNIGNTASLGEKIEAVIAEVRAQRIARVKAERAERKIRQAAEKVEKAEKDRQWRAQNLPHLGREVSKGLIFEGGEPEKLRAANLPLWETALDVAQSLEITTGKLAWLCYHRGATTIDHYRHFTIPKRSGGRRQISAPQPQLRAAQSRVLAQVLNGAPVHEAAMAFRPQLNIAHNAQRHAQSEAGGAAIVVRLDLQDFFPSITFRRVRGVFQSLGYNPGVATLLALLCTESPRLEVRLDGQKQFVALSERFLPQGACTSPALTNVLCRRLDRRLSGAAAHYGFTYTRYADDLVFSTPDSEADVGALMALARRILDDENFQINEKKVAVQRRNGRQTVTGLVINASDGDSSGVPRVSRADLRRFRALLHQMETLGRETMSEKLGADALAYAQGYLSFIHMVNPEQAAKLRNAHPCLQRGNKSA